MTRRGGPNLACDHTKCKHKRTVKERQSRYVMSEKCLDCGATRKGELKVKWSWWRMPPVRLAKGTA